ncbi:hypothetical protein FC652_14545 [Vibrio sp. 05-20-BW147]|nr:hypothetical protein [Vibrio sp. 05-20-BW147]
MPLSISYSPLETRDQDHSQVGVKMSKCLNNEGQLTLFSAHETVSWATFMAAVHSKASPLAFIFQANRLRGAHD